MKWVTRFTRCSAGHVISMSQVCFPSSSLFRFYEFRYEMPDGFRRNTLKPDGMFFSRSDGLDANFQGQVRSFNRLGTGNKFINNKINISDHKFAKTGSNYRSQFPFHFLFCRLCMRFTTWNYTARFIPQNFTPKKSRVRRYFGCWRIKRFRTCEDPLIMHTINGKQSTISFATSTFLEYRTCLRTEQSIPRIWWPAQPLR